MGDLRHLGADAAKPDHQQGASFKHPKPARRNRGAVEMSLGLLRYINVQGAAQCHHHGNGMFSQRAGENALQVGDDDAAVQQLLRHLLVDTGMLGNRETAGDGDAALLNPVQLLARSDIFPVAGHAQQGIGVGDLRLFLPACARPPA